MQGAVALNDEISGEDDGGKDSEDAACDVEKESAGAAGNFRGILLQPGRIDLGSERKMLDAFRQFSQMPGPVGGEVAAVTINGRQREHREQSARQSEHENEKDNGKAAPGAPASDMHFLDHADGRRQHHGKQRAYIDEHEHVTHAVCDPQSEAHAKKEENVRPVVFCHVALSRV